MTEPSAFIDIKIHKPTQDQGSVIEVQADTLCVLAREGEALDRVEYRNGKIYAFGAEWPSPIGTLANHAVGDFVFAQIIANAANQWAICEVVSGVKSGRER